MQELGSTSERGGGGRGHGYGERRSQVRSGITGREGKREPGEGERSRGSEKGQGLRGVADGVQGDERKQEVAEAASALATELLRCEGRKKTRGRRWAGPAQVGCTVLGCGWLLGKVQVISVLYFSVLFCFYLILLPLF